MINVQPNAWGKIYRRVTDGVEDFITVKEARAIVNDAMMGRVSRERSVRMMSSQKGLHDIVYRDGKHVLLTEIDAPEPVQTEAEEWATTHSGFTSHRFQDKRALCRRDIQPNMYVLDHDAYTTRTWVVESSLTLCPRCDAKP